MVRVRFAPSPTGTLHVGGARTALFNYLYARAHGGTFVLRIEDTDTERSTNSFEADILESMKWLGLDWDEGPYKGGEHGPYRQSELTERHIMRAKQLLGSGHAYVDDEGVTRLRYPEATTVVVRDLICGDCSFDLQAIGGEPALLRSDGTPTFHIANVSDDIDMKITHVIRGQDHLANTVKHQLMFEALGEPIPQFAHLPLILGQDGSKLSKRNSEGMTSVKDFKDAGYLPQALVNFLMLLGWSHPEEREQLTVDDAVSVFSLDRVNNTGAKFEGSKLDFLNGWWIRQLEFEQLIPLLRQHLGDYLEVFDQRGESFWETMTSSLRGYLTTLKDAASWGPLICGLTVELSPEVTSRLKDETTLDAWREVANRWLEVLEEHAVELDRDSYTVEQANKLIKVVKKSVDLPAKYIFQGLRVAVTGTTSGPELKELVALLPRDVLLDRVKSVRQTVSFVVVAF